MFPGIVHIVLSGSLLIRAKTLQNGHSIRLCVYGHAIGSSSISFPYVHYNREPP